MSEKEDDKYYVGLDLGTSSVGWAVTDTEYRLKRAKGKTLWGARLFEEAEKAEERRVHRSARRRLHRTHARLKLLEMLFAPEMSKIDPDFYLRLKKSALLSSGRPEQIQGKYTLFNLEDFTDKDFYQAFPTIWHLRKNIIEGDAPKTALSDGEHFDLRLYFLAIHHILKNRGHFLLEGELKNGGGDFYAFYDELKDIANNFDLGMVEDVPESAKEIIEGKKRDSEGKKLGLSDRKKMLAELIFMEDEERDKGLAARRLNLAGLLVGSSVSLPGIFDSEVSKDADYKYSFGSGNFEEKMPEIEEALDDSEMFDLVLAAKKVYDYGILSTLLGNSSTISAAMVRNYEQHKKDLKDLKEVLKPYPELFDPIFRAKNDTVNYNAYIRKAYTEDKSGRRKTYGGSLGQEEINKEILKALEALVTKHPEANGKTVQDLMERARRGELLPKQRGQAKGTIPQQLHHNELKEILGRLIKDYPSFGEVDKTEDETCNTSALKIERLHDFRIPYYCGPLVKGKTDAKGRTLEGGKSEFSWADEEISELVYPWNYMKLVNLSKRADDFIRRMTNECSYVIGEEVLPKASLAYQKFMVLNELNNLKINGQRIEDVEIKKRIFEEVFLENELGNKNITLKSLSQYLKNCGILGVEDTLSGTSETKFLPKMTTHLQFARILGEDYAKKYSHQKLEEVVNLVTILNNEPKMLAKKIEEVLGCDEKQAKKLAKLPFKDWGNFSEVFLSGIRAKINGTEMTILDALLETNMNLMELLAAGFRDAVDEFNRPRKNENTNITYQDVKDLYCSPAVKRTIWQTIKILKELEKVEGKAPERIFLEVTRKEEGKKKGKYTLSRKNELIDKYKAMAKSAESRDLLNELEGYEERDLQQRKLYLYFAQQGKCAYCGERIDIEELNNHDYCDIDHIYPQSKIKDDSITNNLVLVHAHENREKTNRYPIDESIRNKCRGMWWNWKNSGLITNEKFNRLTRSNPLTTEELGSFVNRQLVETAQSVKAVRDLLERMYPKAKIIMSRAEQVSHFREWFSEKAVDKNGKNRVMHEAMPEFIKVRAINDLHHAKDAYLNIVVGNALYETFTSNPARWVEKQMQAGNENWSISKWVLWRDQPSTKSAFRMKGWNYAETIKIVSDTLKRNDVLWTRMSHAQKGAISDLQLVGKGKADGILSGKKGRDPEKYGGYRSLSGAFFALIETVNKKGETQRRIVPVPQIYQNDLKKYVAKKYGEFGDVKIILRRINYKSFIKINGFPMHLSRVDSDVRIGAYHAVQAIFKPEDASYIKKIEKAFTKDLATNKKYTIDEEKDKVSIEENLRIFEVFLEKLDAYKNMPMFSGKIAEIRACKDKFSELGLKEQIYFLHNFLNIFTCGPTTADLSAIVPKAGSVGRSTFNDDVLKYDSVLLILQSPTGLFEKVIDLKTCPPESE